jgi:beta-galactosidase
MSSFSIEQNDFLLDGAPFRILSGAMHYFRVHPRCWKDRMLKMRAMGLNTLETYVAWNLHEPQPEKFDFSGWLNLQRYIGLAGDLGLKVIVRPGPYICAEWEFGGLPAWLLKDPGMRLRCMYQPYIDAVDRFLDQVMRQIVPQQITRGGPVIALQVENEYGSYGNDQKYLKHLEEGMRQRGADVLLLTSDGPSDEMLQYGTLPHVYKTANFGSRPGEAFEKLREYQLDGPLMCTEFWNGWFDHWGERHHTRAAFDAAQALDDILSQGASVNLYMFHGGTNFGFMNGANAAPGPKYQPTVTSYDYDSPLDEAGRPTAKYFAFREVIAHYSPLPDESLPDDPPPADYGQLNLTESAELFNNLDRLSSPQHTAAPEPMEMFGQNYGFILYQTQVSGPREEVKLRILGLHDRAQVFMDDELLGILERESPDKTLSVEVPEHGTTLEFLVENMGRVNYGPELADRKGITEGVQLGQQLLFGWTTYPLPLEDVSDLRYHTHLPEHFPAFFRGTFAVERPADTYLALPGWNKGVVWVNGFNLGRYWKRGPQKTLYIPGVLLNTGENEIVVFELHGIHKAQVELRAEADLG